MKRLVFLFALGFCLTLGAPVFMPGASTPAYAERPFNLQQSLKRLTNNPHYRGRVLGTRVVNTRRGKLVEVRILKSNDRIIIVYLDPRTGGVVGDSG